MVDQIQVIRERLAQAPVGDERLFVTVDLANLHQRAESALLRLQQGQGVCLLGDVRREAQLASPWLMQVPADMDSAELGWTVSLACRHSAVTWLCSPRSMAELASELRRRTEAQLPDRERVLLRYFDPRVLHVLNEVLDDAQHRQFFQLGSGWWLLDRQQQLTRLTKRSGEQASEFVPPLQLSDSQFARMLRAAELDSVMPELVRQVPQEFLQLSPPERVTFTQHWLAKADDFGIEQYPDRVALCILAARLGQDFDLADPWVGLFERVAGGAMTMAQAIEQAIEEGQ